MLLKKVFGAFLLIGGGLWGGTQRAKELSSRAGALESWANAMSLLEGELAFRLPCLPCLLEGLSRRCPGEAGETLTAVSRAFDRLGEVAFEEIWREALDRTAGGLTREDKEPLYRFGGILGRSGREEQEAAAERTRLALEKRACQLWENWNDKGRVYKVLGLSLGAFAAILLL